MVSINRKTASVVVVGAAAAAIGLGISAAARADTTPTPSPTSSPSTPSPGATNPAPGPGDHGHGKGWGPGGRFGGVGGVGKGADLSALASKLGVDETTLRDALKKVGDDLKDQFKAARKSAAPGAKPDVSALQDQFAQLLAKELGLDVNKVKTALAEVRTAAAADRQKAFDDRLDQAVKDGKLTQSEADAVKKAAKEGIIGMGRGPR
ncbi:hypothetical protein GCM10027053_42470 [Intrasporangium mesophilum]